MTKHAETSRYNLILSKEQNFWQLASILTVSGNLPNMTLGGRLLREYSPGTVFTSICVGNLILWLVGVVIISMSYRDRLNAVDNAKKYIGKLGGISVALVFMFSFLIWFLVQINQATQPIVSLFPGKGVLANANIFIRFGAAAGLLISLLAIGGVRLIKWINVLVLPLIFAYHFYAIFTSTNPPVFTGNWTLALPAVLYTLIMPLPGTVNLPTFFRYSRSLADSFLALTLIALFQIFLQTSGMWMRFDETMNLSFSEYTGFSLLAKSILIAFVLLMLICGNLVNIYFASASWETIMPVLGKQKEYTIIGLVGTAAYTFIQISQPMLFIVTLTNSFIASLGIVLLISFLIRIVVKHRPRPFGRFINGLSWLAGCITAFILTAKHFGSEAQIMFVSMGASALFFLFIIFIEETLWSIGHLVFIQKIIRLALKFFKRNKGNENGIE